MLEEFSWQQLENMDLNDLRLEVSWDARSGALIHCKLLQFLLSCIETFTKTHENLTTNVKSTFFEPCRSEICSVNPFLRNVDEREVILSVSYVPFQNLINFLSLEDVTLSPNSETFRVNKHRRSTYQTLAVWVSNPHWKHRIGFVE